MGQVWVPQACTDVTWPSADRGRLGRLTGGISLGHDLHAVAAQSGSRFRSPRLEIGYWRWVNPACRIRVLPAS